MWAQEGEANTSSGPPCNMCMVSVQLQKPFRVGQFRKPTSSVAVAGPRRKLVQRQPFKMMLRAICPALGRVLLWFSLPSSPVTLSTSAQLQPCGAPSTETPLLIYKTLGSHLPIHMGVCPPPGSHCPTPTPSLPCPVCPVASQITAQLPLDESFPV